MFVYLNLLTLSTTASLLVRTNYPYNTWLVLSFQEFGPALNHGLAIALVVVSLSLIASLLTLTVYIMRANRANKENAQLKADKQVLVAKIIHRTEP